MKFTFSLIAPLFLAASALSSTIPDASSNHLEARSGKSWSFPNFNGYTVTSFLKAWNTQKDSYGKNNRAIVKDPAGGSDKVLRLTYPKGSYRPGSGNIVGGTGIYATPLKIPKGAPTVTFSYEVYFPKGFIWNRGGKLPGLYAGHDHCSGGNDAKTCYSTRFMWRKKGMGELYAYIPKNPQVSNICSERQGKGVNFCNDQYGFSLDRGSFTFAPGKWHTIKQTMTPNKVGRAETGKIEVWFDGKPVMSFKKLDFRLTENVNFLGIDFESFFGGSSSVWKTPKTQYIYFNNLQLSYE